MSLFSSETLILADFVKKFGSNFSQADADNINALSINNQLMQDLTWRACNNGDYHKINVATTLGRAAKRRYNQGIAKTRGSRSPVLFPTTMIEAKSQVDIDEYRKDPSVRKDNDDLIFQGINNDIVYSLLYDDNTADPENITGILSYLNTTGHDRVLDGGGSSNLTSILLACFGPSTGTGLFPQSSTPGLKVTDKGEKDIPELDDDGVPTGKYYYGLETHFKWDYGFAMKDDRFFVRIANIDVSDRTDDKFDLMLLNAAWNLIPNHNAGRMCWLMNSAAKSLVDNAVASQSNLLHTEKNNYGQLVDYLHGAPIRVVNSFSINETKVVA